MSDSTPPEPTPLPLVEAGRVTLEILLFRRGPEDFPYAPALLPMLVGLALVLSVVQQTLTLPLVPALVQAAGSVAVLALFTRSLLRARRLGNRTTQTLSALFACGSALTLLVLPALSVLAPALVRVAADPASAETAPLPGGPVLAVMALSLWNFFVMAHILRHALGVRPALGALAAFAAVLVTWIFSSALTALVLPGA